MKNWMLCLLACTTLATAEQKAFLGLSLNLPEVAKFMGTAPEEQQEDPSFKMMLGTMRMLGDQHVDLLLYADPQNAVLPVLTMPGGQAALTKAIEDGPLNAFFVKVADGYKINPELAPPAEGEAKAEGIAMDDLILRFHEGSAILAPEPLHVRHAAQDILPLSSSLAGQQGIIKVDQNLVTLAIDFPENLGDDLADQIAGNELGNALPPAEMVTQLGSTLIDMLFEPLKKIRGFRLGFKFDGENGRKLSYLQSFRDAAEGQKVFDALQAKTLEPGEEVLAGLLETMNSEGFTTRTGYKGKHLILQSSWDKAQDEVIGENVMGVVMGMMMGAAMAETPVTEGEITTEYESPSRYANQESVDIIKDAMTKNLPKNAFVGNYWDGGSTPHLSMAVDRVDVPNLELYRFRVEIQSITATNGMDIYRPEERHGDHMGHFSDTTNLRLTIKPDIAEEMLGKATVAFEMKGPESVQVLNLTEVGQTESSGGVTVTLTQMEKDRVTIKYKGADDIEIVAFDKTGKPLRSPESMGMGTTKNSRFRGYVTHVQVIAGIGETTFTVPVALDLNQGKRYEPPREPSSEIRTRFQSAPLRTYNNISDEEIEALEVRWEPGRTDQHHNALVVDLPKSDLYMRHAFEHSFFGETEEVKADVNQSHGSGKDIRYGIRREGGEDDGVRAVFGKAKFTISRDVQALSFIKASDGAAIQQTGMDGHAYEVTIEKNQVRYPYSQERILHYVAYDDQGRRLRQAGQRTDQGLMKVNYWGQVHEASLTVRSGVTERIIPFDLKAGEYDAAAYEAYKTQVQNRAAIYAVLANAMEAKRNDPTKYSNHLAGYYYLHEKKEGGTPIALIPIEVANSDPTAAEIFNYEVKPYMGYHFAFAKGRAKDDGTGTDRLMNRKPNSSFTWDGGEVMGNKYIDAYIIATPVDPSQPVFFAVDKDNISFQVIEGGKMEYIPSYSNARKWPKAKFVH